MSESGFPYLSAPFPCRLCGRPIRMIRTEKDKSMPVDAAPIKVTRADLVDGEPFRLIDRMGRSRIHLAGETGLYTHFGSCPEYHGSLPPEWWAKGPAVRAPNPTRRSQTHLLDRLAYIEEGLARIIKLHKAKFEPKHMLTEIGHLQKFAKVTRDIIGQQV